jgi:hypothetical protein
VKVWAWIDPKSMIRGDSYVIYPPLVARFPEQSR